MDWKNISLADCAQGNIKDAHLTYKLGVLFLEKLKEYNPNILKLFKEIIYPLAPMFAEMEAEGLHVDLDRLAKVEIEVNSKIENITKQMSELGVLKKEHNLNSNADKADIFYLDDECLGLYPPDRTKKGQPSTSKDTIKLMLVQINNELEKRKLNDKVNSN